MTTTTTNSTTADTGPGASRWDATALGGKTAHKVHGTSIVGPWADGLDVVVFGLGCYWGAESTFWGIPGVHATAAGFASGTGIPGATPTEVVAVVFDPTVVTFDALLDTFWANSDPHPGGNNRPTSHYRSAVFTTSDTQQAAAEASAVATADRRRIPAVATEVAPLAEFRYVPASEQQYHARR